MVWYHSLFLIFLMVCLNRHLLKEVLIKEKTKINFQNSIVEGLSKRPPLDYVATLDSTNLYSNKTKFWSIQRDESNQYIVAFYNGGVKVFDLMVMKKLLLVASGSSYLTSTNPKTILN